MRLPLVWGCVALTVLVLATAEETPETARDGETEDQILAGLSRGKRENGAKAKPKPKPKPCPGCFTSLSRRDKRSACEAKDERVGESGETRPRSVSDTEDKPPQGSSSFSGYKQRLQIFPQIKRKKRDVESKPCPDCATRLPGHISRGKNRAQAPDIKDTAGADAETPNVEGVEHSKRRHRMRRPCPGCPSHRHGARKKETEHLTMGALKDGLWHERKRSRRPSDKKRARTFSKCPGCFTSMARTPIQVRVPESILTEERIKRHLGRGHRQLLLNDEQKSLMERDGQERGEELSPTKAPKRKKSNKKGKKTKEKPNRKPKAEKQKLQQMSEPLHGQHSHLSRSFRTMEEAAPETLESREHHKKHKKEKHHRGAHHGEMLDGQEPPATETGKRMANNKGEKKQKKHQKVSHSGFLSALGTSTLDGEEEAAPETLESREHHMKHKKEKHHRGAHHGEMLDGQV